LFAFLILNILYCTCDSEEGGIGEISPDILLGGREYQFDAEAATTREEKPFKSFDSKFSQKNVSTFYKETCLNCMQYNYISILFVYLFLPCIVHMVYPFFRLSGRRRKSPKLANFRPLPHSGHTGRPL
jgi:hypothetical protein